jgi:hypothetical protein
MSCGNNLVEQFNSNNSFEVRRSVTLTKDYEEVWLYTSYLGKVKVWVARESEDKVLMECMSGRNKDITIRVVDAHKSRVDYNTRPSLRQLESKPAASLSIMENKITFYRLQQAEMALAGEKSDQEGYEYRKKCLEKFRADEPRLSVSLDANPLTTKPTSESLRALYVQNSCVDILFQTSLFLQFLQQNMKRDSINHGKLLLSLYNVPKLDNAYFSGEYMLYGNGYSVFYPLSSVDISAHELSHGLVQNTAGLRYLGHSGALNESFADVLGVAFEFWLYNKFNKNTDTSDDLQGDADWFIGEDVGKTIKYLRNLRDPTQGLTPQPKSYRGRYWSNPNQANRDHGGVHVNSGVPNHCYYQLSQLIGVESALNIFYNCLLKMDTMSDFIDFRDTLLECSPESLRSKTKRALDTVGLTSDAVSDWMHSPVENRRPKPEPTQLPKLEPVPLPEPTQLPKLEPVPLPEPTQLPKLEPVPLPHPSPRQTPRRIPRPLPGQHSRRFPQRMPERPPNTIPWHRIPNWRNNRPNSNPPPFRISSTFAMT